MATLSAFIRVAYSELVTVVVVSLLTAGTALTVVGFGAGLVAGITVLRETVDKRREGIRTSECDRVAMYREVFVGEFRRTAPIGIVLWLSAIAFIWYVVVSGAAENAWLLLTALASAYAFTFAIMLMLRTATLLSLNENVPFPTAVNDAGQHLLGTPSFSVLHATAVVGVVALCVSLLVAVPLLLFGLLALLEVLVYTERNGAGAQAVVLAYQRGDAP